MGEIEVVLPNGEIMLVPEGTPEELIEQLAKRKMAETPPQGIGHALGFRGNPGKPDKFDRMLVEGLGKLGPLAVGLGMALPQTRGLANVLKGGFMKGFSAPRGPASVPTSTPLTGPAPKMPVGTKGDYQGWVTAQDARFPQKSVQELLEDLKRSLAQDSSRKKVQLKKPRGK